MPADPSVMEKKSKGISKIGQLCPGAPFALCASDVLGAYNVNWGSE